MKYAHSLEVDPCGIFSTIIVSGTIVRMPHLSVTQSGKVSVNGLEINHNKTQQPSVYQLIPP